MSKTGNIGEWSEIYVLFKLLADGKMNAGDEYEKVISGIEYQVLQVIRDNSTQKNNDDFSIYTPQVDSQFNYSIVKAENGLLSSSVDRKDFKANALELLKGIEEYKVQKDAEAKQKAKQKRQAKKDGVPFVDVTTKKEMPTPPAIAPFLDLVFVKNIKTKADNKADIDVKYYDFKTCMSHLDGYSIKSQLGQPSTLFNSSQSTNILFKISGLTNPNLAEINNIREQGERIRKIISLGGVFSYVDYDSATFKDNLAFIDGHLPRIWAECVFRSFLNPDEGLPPLKWVVEKMVQDNPLGFKSRVESFYKHKVQSFLIDSSFGMTPTDEWSGKYDATGGFIVVLCSGELICYHFYNRNAMEEYLFNQTLFDHPTRNRNKYGDLELKEDGYYMKLNAQIRFIK